MKVYAIQPKYCKKGLVQFMPIENKTNFIASPTEILFLKIGDRILVNKYENHPYRFLFPYSENIKTENSYNQLFEYRIPYINFRSNFDIYSLTTMRFFKGVYRTLFCYEEINQKDEEEITEELTREQVEAIFNKDAYDSMYIFSPNGGFAYAYNKTDGLILKPDMNIIPSDEEIISLDIEERKYNTGTNRIINNSLNKGLEEDKEKIKPRTIDEIKDLNIYNSLFTKLLLTSKNGIFTLKSFSLMFVEKDKFRLVTRNIPIKVPGNVDVMAYCNENGLEYTKEPETELDLTTEEKTLLSRFHAMYKDGSKIGDIMYKAVRKTPIRMRIPSWMKKRGQQQ